MAPDFTLQDQKGKSHTFSDYRGRWTLLYFYPKDDTPGCTKEACGIRDNFPDFKKLKIVVVGVSVDSVKSHEQFARKYKLPFILLADESKVVVKKYEVWVKKVLGVKSYMGTLRTSFLINPEGIIVKIYRSVDPAIHAAEVIKDVARVQWRLSFSKPRSKITASPR